MCNLFLRERGHEVALSCTNCQTQLTDDAKFCPECGTQVIAPEDKPQPRFCLHCGVRLTENAKFCLACGSRVTADETPFYQKIDKAVVAEIFKSPYPLAASPLDRIIHDFESEKLTITLRVERYAEYLASLMDVLDWFNRLSDLTEGSIRYAYRCPFEELDNFWMNKPNAHEAFVCQTLIDWFTSEARRRDYIDDEGKFCPVALDYLNRWGRWKEEELQTLRIPSSYPELEALAKKDDDLFPPPQPIRVEVAGVVLNFTTDEAVLVVYTDCLHKGKKIEIWNCQEPFIDNMLLDQGMKTAEVVERFNGDTPVCSAIFNHIPFVNNYLKYFQYAIRQVDFTMHPDYSFSDPWKDTITVVRGKVTQLDWRGRK